jgi:hypothetical protein
MTETSAPSDGIVASLAGLAGPFSGKLERGSRQPPSPGVVKAATGLPATTGFAGG